MILWDSLGNERSERFPCAIRECWLWRIGEYDVMLSRTLNLAREIARLINHSLGRKTTSTLWIACLPHISNPKWHFSTVLYHCPHIQIYSHTKHSPTLHTGLKKHMRFLNRQTSPTVHRIPPLALGCIATY